MPVPEGGEGGGGGALGEFAARILRPGVSQALDPDGNIARASGTARVLEYFGQNSKINGRSIPGADMTFPRQIRTASVCLLALATLVACSGSPGAPPPPPPPPAPVAPSITTQPAAATVADGATANFSVTAAGDVPLSYQWRRNGTDLVNGGGVTGATTAALALVSPFSFNASQISVRVSNAAGNVTSANALLTVTAVAPTITTQPANVGVVSGSPATFSVVVAGGTPTVTYQWRRGGVVIAGATGASYTLASTVVGDNGASFTVDVINPAGTLASAAATLTVTAPAGKAWGAAVQLSSGVLGADAGYPQVAMDSSGNAIAVWQEEDAAILRNAVWGMRYPAGGTWAGRTTIDFLVGNAVRPQIAMTPNGEAVAAFPQSISNGGGIVNLISNRYSGGWGTPAAVDDATDMTNADSPQLALAPNGAATAVYSQSDGVSPRSWANQSSAAGLWGTPAIIDGAGPTFNAEVAVAANGHAVATWVQQTGAFTRALLASRNVGGGWSAPTLVSADTTPMDTGMRVAADANGNTMAVWSQRQVSGLYAVRAARLDAATGTWGAAVTLNGNPTRDAYRPQLGVDSNGNVLVVWYEPISGVQSNRYTAATASWGGSVAVQPIADIRGVLPRVGVDALGNAVAVWSQPSVANASRTEVWGAHFDGAAGSWAVPLKLMTDTAAYWPLIGTNFEPAVAVNASGEAVVVWYQQTDAPATEAIWARVYR